MQRAKEHVRVMLKAYYMMAHAKEQTPWAEVGGGTEATPLWLGRCSSDIHHIYITRSARGKPFACDLSRPQCAQKTKTAPTRARKNSKQQQDSL
jgi:hypothetical protein